MITNFTRPENDSRKKYTTLVYSIPTLLNFPTDPELTPCLWTPTFQSGKFLTLIMLEKFMYYTPPSPNFSFNFRISVTSMYLKMKWKIVWILISWLLRSQLIRIYTVFKTGLAGFSMQRINDICMAVHG